MAQGLVFFLAAVLNAGSPGAEVHASAAEAPGGLGSETWRVAQKCGVNALYVALRLHGKQVDYRELESRLPVGEDGSTLADMKACARAFGLHAEVVKATPEALTRCRLPVIAHCEQERSRSGHYIVVMSVTPAGVQFIDGTTTAISTLTTSEFKQLWTGYLLVFENRLWWSLLFPGAAILGLCSIGLATWARLRERTAHAPPAGGGPTGLGKSVVRQTTEG